jgi:hypothetical protein
MSQEPVEEVPCTGADAGCACPACRAMREAAASGAHPSGVPVRVYGGYLEARAALRASAVGPANRVLEWLVGHLAEERGARPEESLAAKIDRLRREGAISPRLRQSLIDQSLSPEETLERAWALLSIVEHAFHRLYL